MNAVMSLNKVRNEFTLFLTKVRMIDRKETPLQIVKSWDPSEGKRLVLTLLKKTKEESIQKMKESNSISTNNLNSSGEVPQPASQKGEKELDFLLSSLESATENKYRKVNADELENMLADLVNQNF
jgi:hypothetical protein